MTRTDLYVFGGASTALEIAEAAAVSKEPFGRVLLVVPSNEDPDGVTRIDVDTLDDRNELAGHGYILSMTRQPIRRSCLEIAERVGLLPVNVIHPQAWIAPSAKLGRGIYVAAQSIVSSQVQIHDHVLINYQVSIGHDAMIDEHTAINPGAKIGGHCRIGSRVLFGANAFVFQGKSVGDDVAVDAMTYVDRDIEPGMICTSKSLKVYKRAMIKR